MKGPERFFYDKSSYTGTHQHGGPEAASKGDGTVGRGGPTSLQSAGPSKEVRRECDVCGHRWLDKYRKPECPKCGAKLKPPPAAPAEKAAAGKHVLREALSEPDAGPKGPERFFYDKSSYTGTHQHGGPEQARKGLGTGSATGGVISTAGEIGADGRRDLSDMVSREARQGLAKPRAAGQEVRRECPTCGYRWLDKYGKRECPKCQSPL